MMRVLHRKNARTSTSMKNCNKNCILVLNKRVYMTDCTHLSYQQKLMNSCSYRKLLQWTTHRLDHKQDLGMKEIRRIGAEVAKTFIRWQHRTMTYTFASICNRPGDCLNPTTRWEALETTIKTARNQKVSKFFKLRRTQNKSYGRMQHNT